MIESLIATVRTERGPIIGRLRALIFRLDYSIFDRAVEVAQALVQGLTAAKERK